MSSLEPLLNLVLAATPNTIVPASARETLQSAARALPPVLNLGFECRLGSSPTVDFHLGVKRRSGDEAVLKTFLKTHEPNQVDASWAKLLAFLESSDTLYESLHSIFLEMDETALTKGRVIPSLFLIFKPGAATPDLLEALHLHFTGRSLAPGIRMALETAYGCGGEVNGLGLMLAREVETVRLNIQPAKQPLSAADPFALLGALGWRGDSVAIAEWYPWTVEAFDQVVLALDVDSRVHPHIGLECAIGTSDPAPKRWSIILDNLVTNGLCLPAKRDALLDWLKPITSADVPGQWPPALTAQLLLSPGDRSSRLYRAIPHIKLSFVPGQPISAKAYLGAVHQWIPLYTGTGFA